MNHPEFLMKKYFVILLLLLPTARSFSQADGCWRAIQAGNTSLTQHKFDSLVTSYINKSQKKQKLDTADYILLVKISNSIFFNRYGSLKDGCWPEKKKLYQQFSALFGGKSLFDNLTRYLGVCIPNHGMGCYYSRFNLDWGGASPNENSLIRVTN